MRSLSWSLGISLPFCRRADSRRWAALYKANSTVLGLLFGKFPRNTAVRFFHKLRERIALKQQNWSWQLGKKSNLMKVILVVRAKESVGEVMWKSCYFGSFEAWRQGVYASYSWCKIGYFNAYSPWKLSPIVLATPIVGIDIMRWMPLDPKIIAPIIQNFLLITRIRLTASKTSGAKRNDTCESSIAPQGNILICSWRGSSGGLMWGHLKRSLSKAARVA